MMEQLFRRALESEGPLNPAIQSAIYDYAMATKEDPLLEALLGRPDLTDELDEKIGNQPTARIVAAWLRRKKRSPEQIRARLEVEKRKKRITVFEVLASLEDQEDLVYEMAASIVSVKIAIALLDNDKATAAHKTAARTIATLYNTSSLSYRQQSDINRVLSNRAELADVLATHSSDERLLTIAARAGTLTGPAAKVAFDKMLTLAEVHAKEIVRTMTASTNRWRNAHGDESALIENVKCMTMLAPVLNDPLAVLAAAKRLRELHATIAPVLEKDSSTPKSLMAALENLTSSVSPDSPLSRLRNATTAEELAEALKPFANDLKEEHGYRSTPSAVRDLVVAAVLTNRAANITQVRRAIKAMANRGGYYYSSSDLNQYATFWLDDFEALTEFVAAGLINDDDALEALAKNFTPESLWKAGCELIMSRDRESMGHWHSQLFSSRYADRSRAVAMSPSSFNLWTEPALAEATVGALSDVLGDDLEGWRLLNAATSARPACSFEETLEAVRLARRSFGTDTTAMELWLGVLGADTSTDASALVRRVIKLRSTITDDRPVKVLTMLFTKTRLITDAKEAKVALDQALAAYSTLGDDSGFWDALNMMAPRHKQDVKKLFLTCRRAVVDERTNERA